MSGNFPEIFLDKYEGKIFLESIFWNEEGCEGANPKFTDIDA